MEEEIDLKEKREKLVKGIKNFFSETKEKMSSKEESSEDEIDLGVKREQLIKFLREKKDWLIYAVLGVIIWFGSFIRTQNLPLLRDVTTGK